MTHQQYSTADAIAFTNGDKPDAQGRMIGDYFAFSDQRWEECHNHVQWAFPSNIPSDFNLNAPVVDLQEYANGLTLTGRNNLMRLVADYMRSLGLELLSDTVGGEHDEVQTIYWFTTDTLSNTQYPWLRAGDHNHRRLTRLLNLLHTVDAELALLILHMLCEVFSASFANLFGGTDRFNAPTVTPDTMHFWLTAARKGLTNA